MADSTGGSGNSKDFTQSPHGCGGLKGQCQPCKLVPLDMGEPFRERQPDGSVKVTWTKKTANGLTTITTFE
jgi:hypothetical protein